MRARAPIKADARCERFVVSVCQTIRNGLISGKNESNGGHSCGIAPGFAGLRELKRQRAAWCERAGINRRPLSRPESLHLVAAISHRCVQLPAHTIVHGQIRLDLPTVLREEIDCLAPY